MDEQYTYRNCKITITVERRDFDCGPSLFEPTAFIMFASGEFQLRLAGRFDESRARACKNLLKMAMAQVDTRYREQLISEQMWPRGRWGSSSLP